MTTTLDVPLEQAIPAPSIDSKSTAKRRIRCLASCDTRLHRMQRRLFRGRLTHTRSVAWNAMVELVHATLERCRMAQREGTFRSAHRMVEEMWWNSSFRWDSNSPEARARIVYILECAIDVEVLPANLCEWPRLAILALYPRASAHVVAGSLGYATGTHSAHILAAAHCREADFCEWIDSRCGRTTNREEYLAAMKAATLRVATSCVQSPSWAPRRRRHSSPMSSYARGRIEVLRELLDLNGKDPKLAAWF